jgi:hypothetical protein
MLASDSTLTTREAASDAASTWDPISYRASIQCYRN